jgi:hypothetical protein
MHTIGMGQAKPIGYPVERLAHPGRAKLLRSLGEEATANLATKGHKLHKRKNGLVSVVGVSARTAIDVE